MYKILNKLQIGKDLLLSIEWNGSNIKNGMIVHDEVGNTFEVVSIGMTHFINPEDIGKSLDLIIRGNTQNLGENIIV